MQPSVRAHAMETALPMARRQSPGRSWCRSVRREQPLERGLGRWSRALLAHRIWTRCLERGSRCGAAAGPAVPVEPLPGGPLNMLTMNMMAKATATAASDQGTAMLHGTSSARRLHAGDECASDHLIRHRRHSRPDVVMRHNVRHSFEPGNVCQQPTARLLGLHSLTYAERTRRSAARYRSS